LLLPIEQVVIRRLTIDRSRTGLPREGGWLGIATVIGSAMFAWAVVEDQLNGDRRFVAFTAITVAAHLWFAAARGHLAGWRRFRAYGTSSALASVVRLVIAIGITIIHPSASAF